MKFFFYTTFAFLMLFGQQTAKAQTSNLDARLLEQASNIQTLLQTQLRRMNIQDKRQALEILTETKRTLRDLSRGGSQPTPGNNLPNRGKMFCSWLDGYSYGISERGHHLIEQVNGYLFSKRFYGNRNRESQEECNKELISQYIPMSDVSRSKRSSCGCQWYPADRQNQPSARGWHMTYKISVPSLDGEVTVHDSVGFYGNESIRSEEACLQALRINQFRCN